MMIRGNHKSKKFVIIIALLLMANIAGIVYNFVVMRQHKHPKMSHTDRKGYVGRYLKDSLHFTELQLKQFDSISQQNVEASTPLFDSLRVEKEKRMKFLIKNDFSDSALTEAVQRSSVRQMALDREMLAYFKNIRLICTHEQKKQFDSSFFKMMGHGRSSKKKN